MTLDNRLVDWYRFYLFGRLIMGVSHEADNHLSVVMGYSELIGMNPKETDKVIKGVGRISGSAGALSKIFKSYSYFARPHSPDDTVFNPGETILEVISFAGYDLRRGGVEIEIKVNEDDIPLRGDRRDFAFTLLNIMINASEAMSESGGRQLIDINPGEKRVEIHVVDQGTGIPPGMDEKIFEPYFSSGKEGYHPGLGLSVSRYVAKRFGGSIHYSSEIGKGSVFTVEIPIS